MENLQWKADMIVEAADPADLEITVGEALKTLYHHLEDLYHNGIALEDPSLVPYERKLKEIIQQHPTMPCMRCGRIVASHILECVECVGAPPIS